MRPRATTCRKCGAPRDPALPKALCRACHNEDSRRRMAKSARTRAMRKYERLGLVVGGVWTIARREH